MKKILIFSVMLCVAMCVFASGVEEQGATNKPIELVYTTDAVSTDALAGAQQVFKKTVEELSEGQIKVLTYDSSTLFKQDQEVAACKSGQADITTTAPGWLTDGSPWVSMFTAGYLFKNYDHMRTFYDSEECAEMFDTIAQEQGIRPLGAEYFGARQINLVDDIEIKTPEDLNGINLRMPNSESWIFLGKALGANPTPISISELYMALQSHTIDGQDNPLPRDKSAKFYEVTKSITITNHLLDTVWIGMNEAKWQSLNEEQQGWVMAGVRAGIEYCDSTNLKAEAELIDFFKSEGLSIYYADADAFSKHVLGEYLNSDYADDWNKDLFKAVQKMGEQE